jgi:ABC-2 type transport system permease protein
MTFAAADWPSDEPSKRPRERGASHGIAVVWRWELIKLSSLLRIRVLLAACLAAPFAVAGSISVQSAVPSDTLFGQWVHMSGFALPMVLVGFAGQWALPVVAAIVAGDVFSAEDHLGTWKALLTRSRTRTELFYGKVAAGLTFCVVALVVLGTASLGAGLLLGAHAVVGLSGQLVAPGQTVRLVLLSWLLQLPPMVGFAAVAFLLSIISRNSVVGVGGPVLLGLVFQLLTLVNLPATLRIALLSTSYQSWHGLWTTPRFYGPIWHALATSATWLLVCLVSSWLLFLRRSFRVS